MCKSWYQRRNDVTHLKIVFYLKWSLNLFRKPEICLYSGKIFWFISKHFCIIWHRLFVYLKTTSCDIFKNHLENKKRKISCVVYKSEDKIWYFLRSQTNRRNSAFYQTNLLLDSRAYANLFKFSQIMYQYLPILFFIQRFCFGAAAREGRGANFYT